MNIENNKIKKYSDIIHNIVYLFIIYFVFFSVLEVSLVNYSFIGSFLKNINIKRLSKYVRLLMLLYGFFLLYLEGFNRKRIWLMITWTVLFFFSYITARHLFLFDTFFIAVFLSEHLDYKKVINTYFYTILFAFFLIVFLHYLEIIPDHQFTRDGRIRTSLSFNHPNDLAFTVLQLLSLYILKRDKSINILDLFVVLLTVVWLYVFPNSETSTAVAGLLLFFLVLSYSKKNISIRKLKYATVLFVLFITFFVYFVTVTGCFSGFISQISGTLNSRFVLGKYGLEKYGVRLFGNNGVVFRGDIEISKDINQQYFVLDCLYLNIPIYYGVLPGLFTLLVYCITAYRACTSENYLLWTELMLIAIYSISQTGLALISSAFWMVCAFCSYPGENPENTDNRIIPSKIRLNV